MGKPCRIWKWSCTRRSLFPFASIVMSLVALPFSFRLGRRGTLYGVGIGIVLGMVFYAMLAFTSTLGETGALPPLVAVWSPEYRLHDSVPISASRSQELRRR